MSKKTFVMCLGTFVLSLCFSACCRVGIADLIVYGKIFTSESEEFA